MIYPEPSAYLLTLKYKMNWFLLWQTTSSFCRPDNDWSSLVSAAQTSSSAPPASPFSSELGPRTQSCRWVQCHSSPLQPLNEATFVRENRQTHTWHISKSTKYLVGILVFFVTNKSKPSGFAAGVCHHLHTECFTCKGQRKWMENETMWLHRNIREVQHFSTSSIKSTIHKLLPVHRPRPDHPPRKFCSGFVHLQCALDYLYYFQTVTLQVKVKGSQVWIDCGAINHTFRSFWLIDHSQVFPWRTNSQYIMCMLLSAPLIRCTTFRLALLLIMILIKKDEQFWHRSFVLQSFQVSVLQWNCKYQWSERSKSSRSAANAAALHLEMIRKQI